MTQLTYDRSLLGYVIMHIPMGLLAERIGGKIVIVLMMTLTSLSTLLTPLCVRWGGAVGLIAVRVVIGTVQGGMWPATSTLVSAWIPTKEKTTICSIAFSGIAVISILDINSDQHCSHAIFITPTGWADCGQLLDWRANRYLQGLGSYFLCFWNVRHHHNVFLCK